MLSFRKLLPIYAINMFSISCIKQLKQLNLLKLAQKLQESAKKIIKVVLTFWFPIAGLLRIDGLFLNSHLLYRHCCLCSDFVVYLFFFNSSRIKCLSYGFATATMKFIELDEILIRNICCIVLVSR